MSATLKTVGQSGQISLGKAYAGKTLRMARQPDGSILLTAVVVVPEHQMWTLEEPARSAIARGMGFAAQHPAVESDVTALVSQATAGQEASRGPE